MADSILANEEMEKKARELLHKINISCSYREDIETVLAFASHVRSQAIEECAAFVDDFDDIQTYGGYYNQDNARATLHVCAEQVRLLAAPPVKEKKA